MHKYYLVTTCCIILILFAFCGRQESPEEKPRITNMEITSRPFARYWWFASEIKKEDIRYNLDWLKSNGFGGFELAWVYPLNRMNRKDTTYTPRQQWLSPAWQEMVSYAMEYADSIGLACDLTMGTLWPFGDSYVPPRQAARRWGDTAWRQEITASWEYPQKGYVVDHLTPAHYLTYIERMLDSFPDVRSRIPVSGFIDSWEVETRGLWSESFAADFTGRFGYDIRPFMDSIYADHHAAYRYDYMKLISDKVVAFYKHYDSILNAHGLVSRGQCSGAPCDMISAYACMDIPEGEALLYEPEFSSIPASAALLAGKDVVSAETFTCLYGWPRDYIRKEQVADLKLLADALFANGINHIVWHGKPHNPAGNDTVGFYASVHLGPGGALAGEIVPFNDYLANVSANMKRGRTYTDVAVYLPLEDTWIAGDMPLEKQFKWAWGWYEMRYRYFPAELRGYSPTWVNGNFLRKGKVVDGQMHIGEAVFNCLYVDACYLDHDVLQRIHELAGEGLPVILKNLPEEAGAKSHGDWQDLLHEILALDHVTRHFSASAGPLIAGESIPPFWCRQTGDSLYIFFAHPRAAGLEFPLSYGQSFCSDTLKLSVTISFRKKKTDLDLVFEPYQSLLYWIHNGHAVPVDITFYPQVPEVMARPAGYRAPWLVE